MARPEEILGRLSDICGDLIAACGPVDWAWEGRFDVMLCALSAGTMPLELDDKLEAALGHRFSVEAAPVPIATGAADKLGGLRPGQYLFTTDPDARVILYCAYWPWGGGGKVSLRVGLYFSEAFAEPDLIATWFSRGSQ